MLFASPSASPAISLRLPGSSCLPVCASVTVSQGTLPTYGVQMVRDKMRGASRLDAYLVQASVIGRELCMRYKYRFLSLHGCPGFFFTNC